MYFAVGMEDPQTLGMVIVRVVVKGTGRGLVWKLYDCTALPRLGALKRSGLARDENFCTVLFQEGRYQFVILIAPSWIVAVLTG